MEIANQKIRLTAGGVGVHLWQVAEAMGITEFTLSRKLRHELPDDETEKILTIIHDLAKQNNIS